MPRTTRAAQPSMAQLTATTKKLEASIESKLAQVKAELSSVQNELNGLDDEVRGYLGNHAKHLGSTLKKPCASSFREITQMLDSLASDNAMLANNTTGVEQYVAMLERRIAAIEKSTAEEKGEEAAGTTLDRLSALEKRLVKPSAKTERAQVPTSKLEALPLEVQLLVAEQLDYRSLKRLERVSSSMQALVATPTRVLDRTLWRAEENEAQLLEFKKSGKKFELHPVINDLTLERNQTLEQARVGQRRGKALLLAHLAVRNENATWPPVGSVYIDNNVEHNCIGACGGQESSTEASPEAVSVEYFVRCSLESTHGACAVYCQKAGSYVNFDWEYEELEVEEGEGGTLTFTEPSGIESSHPREECLMDEGFCSECEDDDYGGW